MRLDVRSEYTLKKATATVSANKVTGIVFWDVRGIIHVDYFENGQSDYGDYYASVHTCALAVAKFRELGYHCFTSTLFVSFSTLFPIS